MHKLHLFNRKIDNVAKNPNENKVKKLFIIRVFFIAITLLIAIALITIDFFYDGNHLVNANEVMLKIQNKSSLHFVRPIAVILTGISMPMIGLCMQTTTQNKLADPTTLGFFPLVTTGQMMQQLIINLLKRNHTILINNLPIILAYTLPILLSFLILLINYLIVKGKGTKKSFKAILIGFGLSAIFTAINFIVSEYGNGIKVEPMSWLIQSALPNDTYFIVSGTIIGVCMIIIYALSNKLAIMQKDMVLAKTLGLNVDAIYWTIGVCAILITISSVLILGGVILIGMVIPYIVRLITKSNNFNYLLPASSILGLTLLSASSLFNKHFNVNINIIIAIVSFPVMFAILFKKTKVK